MRGNDGLHRIARRVGNCFPFMDVHNTLPRCGRDMGPRANSTPAASSCGWNEEGTRGLISDGLQFRRSLEYWPVDDVERGVGGLRIGPAGYARFPKFGDGPIGAVRALAGVAFPFAVLYDRWDSPISLTPLTDARLLQEAVSNHVMSQIQVDNLTLFLGALVLIHIVGLPIYVRENLEKLTGLRSFSVALRRRWLGQIAGIFGIGAAFAVVALGLGKFIYWGAPLGAFTSSKFMFVFLVSLGCSLHFTVEALACAVLYVCSYFDMHSVRRP